MPIKGHIELMGRKILVALTHGFYLGAMSLLSSLTIVNATDMWSIKQIRHDIFAALLAFGFGVVISFGILTKKEDLK